MNENELKSAKTNIGIKLTTQQNEVFEKIKTFMKSYALVFILRGYACTGKTTIVKVIAD